jgi:hypothetical protein
MFDLFVNVIETIIEKEGGVHVKEFNSGVASAVVLVRKQSFSTLSQMFSLIAVLVAAARVGDSRRLVNTIAVASMFIASISSTLTVSEYGGLQNFKWLILLSLLSTFCDPS